MVNFLVRVLLFLVGLVVAASLLVAVGALLAVWAVRYGWARLTGRAAAPWVMRFDPRSGFERFRAASAPAAPSAEDKVAARARGESVESLRRFGDSGGVTDVQPKRASAGER